MDGGVGFQSSRGAEVAKDQSYPLTIGVEGATERRTMLLKGSSVESRKVCCFMVRFAGKQSGL